MLRVWLGTGTLGRAYVRPQIKEPDQVPQNRVKAPGVRAQQWGRTRKEASIETALGRTPVREGAKTWSHWTRKARHGWRVLVYWVGSSAPWRTPGKSCPDKLSIYLGAAVSRGYVSVLSPLWRNSSFRTLTFGAKFSLFRVADRSHPSAVLQRALVAGPPKSLAHVFE